MHLVWLSHDLIQAWKPVVLWDASDWLSLGLIQAEWERSRKELDKARHDVERLRRAVDRSDVEKRDQQHKAAAVKQALQVSSGMNAAYKQYIQIGSES